MHFHVDCYASTFLRPTTLGSSLMKCTDLLLGIHAVLLPDRSILIIPLLVLYTHSLACGCAQTIYVSSPKHQTWALPLISPFLIPSNLATPKEKLSFFISAIEISASCCHCSRWNKSFIVRRIQFLTQSRRIWRRLGPALSWSALNPLPTNSLLHTILNLENVIYHKLSIRRNLQVSVWDQQVAL